MSEMIERVAKALFQWQHGHDRWDEAEPEVREDACEAARATLEAIREPTHKMEDAFYNEPHTNAGSKWRAMVDGALCHFRSP